MAGRPTKLTPEVQAAICEHLANGATLEVAAQAEGITRQTVTNWRMAGGKGTEPYAAFLVASERARARFETDTLSRLRKLDESATLDPKIAAPLVKSLTWLLERTRRERYGTLVTVKVEEAKDHLLDTLERVCERLGSTEVLVAVLEELEREGTGEASAAEERPVH